VKNNLKVVDYLLTDEIMDAPPYWCVIATSIGCNTLPGGVYGLVGANQLHVLIDEQKPLDATTALVDIVIAAKKGRVTEDELHVVIDVLMHESFNTRKSSRSQQLSGRHRTFKLVVRCLLNCTRFMTKS